MKSCPRSASSWKRRNMFPVLLILLSVFPSEASAADWILAWAEEFNYPGCTQASPCPPDQTLWFYEEGFLRNNEIQYYTDRLENVRVEDGNLVLEARNDNYQGNAVTSGSIMTMNDIDYTYSKLFSYGRLEVRAKLPTGKGTWPAIWQTGKDYDWPECGEIDLMENYGGIGPYTIHQSVHTAYKYGNTDQTSAVDISAPWQNYHVYAIERYPDRIDFFIDDTKTWTFYKDGNPGNWPFDEAFDIKLNLAFGGNYNPVDYRVLPQKYFVDYVRYFQINTTSLLSISANSFPVGTVSSSYNQTLSATGGTIPYAWSIVSGALPEGLALASDTGIIYGIPTGSAGTSSFTVRCTDNQYNIADKALSIRINSNQIKIPSSPTGMSIH